MSFISQYALEQWLSKEGFYIWMGNIRSALNMTEVEKDQMIETKYQEKVVEYKKKNKRAEVSRILANIRTHEEGFNQELTNKHYNEWVIDIIKSKDKTLEEKDDIILEEFLRILKEYLKK